MALALASSSCAVKRELAIRSFPPGAAVRVDEELVGVTPVAYRFQDYGSLLVTLYKEGYRTRSTRIRLEAPWYLSFPVDLITELILPFGWSDRRELTIELEIESGEIEQPDFQLVRARAERLRRAGPEGPRALEVPTVDLQPLPAKTGNEP